MNRAITTSEYISALPHYNLYSAFVCTGDSERGAYECRGGDYAEAARQFGLHFNECSRSSKYGNAWKEVGKKEGYPKCHMFLEDEKGNRLLLIDKHETTTLRLAYL